MEPATAIRRLPGLYFVTASPPPRETLPRMDVAAFVGFASSGPLDVPVPVEDAARFRDVFGPDLPLAWNPQQGRRDTAHLGAAVEAFFANGGRRCWVVRVARGPATNVFVPPGLVTAAEGRPAAAPARSPGSWSDALKAGCVLEQQPFEVRSAVPFAPDPAAGRFVTQVSVRPDPVRAGDLVRCMVGDDLVVFAVAESVSGGDDAGRSAVRLAPRRWFRTRRADLPATFAATAVLAGDVPERDVALGPCEVTQPGPDGGAYEVLLDPDVPALPAPGDVLHVDGPGGARLWLSVQDTHQQQLPGPSAPLMLQVTAAAGYWPFSPTPIEAQAVLGAATPGAVVLERLRFSLLAWRERGLLARVDRLGFNDVPPRGEGGREAWVGARFWALLPSDQVLFALRDDQPVVPAERTLAREVSEPRFPFCGPRDADARLRLVPPAEAHALADQYLPFGMPTRPAAALARGPIPPAPGTPPEVASALARDGLAQFDAALFVDPDLAASSVATLASHAFDKRYVRRQPLVGLHSLSAAADVSLLAVPDAVHRGWALETPLPPRRLAAPTGLAATLLELPDAFRLAWTHDDAGVTFELEEAVEPTFARPVSRYRGAEPAANVYFETGCQRPYFYRVRAVLSGLVSPWSETLRLVAPLPAFASCAAGLAAPEWDVASPPDGAVAWTEVAGASAYLLQEAGDPAFLTARAIRPDAWLGPRRYVPAGDREGTRYYRVRAEHEGTAGPWSTTMRLDAPQQPVWTVVPDELGPGAGPAAVEALRLWHAELMTEHLGVARAVLRFCAARGDVFAVLSFPERYRERELHAHVAALRGTAAAGTPAGALRPDELHALSYGGVYHPWLTVRGEGERAAIRAVPPDGAVCGLMAAHAVTRGAWIAPANVPVRGVLGLRTPFDADAWQRLLAAQVNLLRPDPRGVGPMSADTLAAEAELRPVGVRRLLLLLRRLLLREGDRYVFESNTPALRQRVVYQLTGLMEQLFRRGAFAGATPRAAFVVDAGTSLNTPERVDRGQLVVDVRVAPARPMEYITVRLVQANGTLTTVEEV